MVGHELAVHEYVTGIGYMGRHLDMFENGHSQTWSDGRSKQKGGHGSYCIVPRARLFRMSYLAHFGQVQ